MAEDIMELASDFDRRPDTEDDIEIDLDLPGDQPHDQDDDYMIEDARSEIEVGMQPSHIEDGNDDVMLDEDEMSQVMPDDITVPDEELFDVIDSVHEDPNAALDPHDEGHFGHTDYSLEDANQQCAPQNVPEDIDHGNLQAPFTDEGEIETIILPQTSPKEETRNDIQSAEKSNQSVGALNAEVIQSADLRDEGLPTVHPSSEAEEPIINQELSDTSSNSKRSEEEDSQDRAELPQTGTHTHPIIVLYGESEISLFPPSNQDNSNTFFLRDKALANGSIKALLAACKVVLANNVDDNDELEIRFEELGLYVSEDSAHASNTIFSQVVDVHVQLLLQDGVDNPGPLYVSLKTRPRFSKRLEKLVAAASEGKGISQLPFLETSGDEEIDTVNTTTAIEDDEYDEETEQKDDFESEQKVEREPEQSNHEVEAVQNEDLPKPASTNFGSEAQVTDLGHAEDPGTILPAMLNTDNQLPSNPRTKQDYPSDTEDGQHRVLSQDISVAEGEDNGSQIDYEDDDDAGRAASTGSSTLQGDDVAFTKDTTRIENTESSLKANIKSVDGSLKSPAHEYDDGQDNEVQEGYVKLYDNDQDQEHGWDVEDERQEEGNEVVDQEASEDVAEELSGHARDHYESNDSDGGNPLLTYGENDAEEAETNEGFLEDDLNTEDNPNLAERTYEDQIRTTGGTLTNPNPTVHPEKDYPDTCAENGIEEPVTVNELTNTPGFDQHKNQADVIEPSYSGEAAREPGGSIETGANTDEDEITYEEDDDQIPGASDETFHITILKESHGDGGLFSTKRLRDEDEENDVLESTNQDIKRIRLP
ncbi:MAG: hypothetical protein M1827_003378 [Pycnora praestabilis]|nr:MAG: hypothetical protein M1827_003378 [Pycnora praestabilis]